MNCNKITYFIEKGYLTELSISEKIRIRLHKLICKCCKNYAPDSDVVNRILLLLKEEENSSTNNLSEAEKQEMKKVLEHLQNT